MKLINSTAIQMDVVLIDGAGLSHEFFVPPKAQIDVPDGCTLQNPMLRGIMLCTDQSLVGTVEGPGNDAGIAPQNPLGLQIDP